MASKAKSAQKSLPLPPPNTSRRAVYDLHPPRVESLESLGLLLAEIARVDAIANTVKARTAEQLAAVALTAGEQLTVELPGIPAPLNFADWRNALVEAAEKFCDKHREEILEDGRKSRDLTHGRVGWELEKQKLEPLDDFDEHGNPRIPEETLAELRQHLNKISELARFLDVKVTWRKAELVKAFTDQEIGLRELRRAGFIPAYDSPKERGEDFYLKTFIGEAKSEPAERPK
jgi:hypothetical protein